MARSPSALPPLPVEVMRWGDDEEWEVLECTFSEAELKQLLDGTFQLPQQEEEDQAARSKL